ncbi:MAG: hypothetical protein U0667_15315 [Chloroflexota bacterium]
MSLHVQGEAELIRRLTMIGVQDGRFGPRILRRWQVLTVQKAKANVAPHKRTGNLQRSIVPGPIGMTAAQVIATAAYAGIVEGGSRAHEIRPRNARVLAWGGDRRLSGTLRSGASPTHFARVVHHPGTKPYPFLAPAARDALGETDLVGEVITAWNDAA